MIRLAIGLPFLASLAFATVLATGGIAEERRSQSADWDAKYEQILQRRPDIRNKVASGGATKEDVIEWMKKGGDAEPKVRQDRYYGWKVQLRDPENFYSSQETRVYSGPQPGEALPRFEATGVVGTNAGKSYNPAAQPDEVPQMLIFQDQSGVARKGLFLLAPVLQSIARHSQTPIHSTVVFLGDDPTELDRQQLFGLNKGSGIYEMAQSLEGREGPGAYGLDRNAAMTIIIAKGGKVLHNFAFLQPMLYPDPHVVGALAEVIGEAPHQVVAWLLEDNSEEEDTSDKASDNSKPKPGTQKAASEEKSEAARQRPQVRQRYERGNIEVKDPAEFRTEGKQIFSGPQPGEDLPGFKAISLAGKNKEKEIEPIALAKGRPQILIFQDDSGVAVRGLLGFVRALQQLDKKSDQDLHISSIFLTDDMQKMSEFASRFSNRLIDTGADVTTMSPDGRDGPGAYGLNRNIAQTIILAKDGKVTRNFIFPQGLLYADPHVMGGVAELLGEDRETVAKWLSEAATSNPGMRMRREANAPAAPQVALRNKLGELVRAGKLTRAEALDLYRTAFPEENPQRGEERPNTSRE